MIMQLPWVRDFLSSNVRERDRLRSELGKMNGALQLLMKPRNGQKWSAHDRMELRNMLQAASEVSPYLIVLALPGSVLILPLLAWRLDVRRGKRAPQAVGTPAEQEASAGPEQHPPGAL